MTVPDHPARRSRIVISADARVTLDGVELDVDGGWQAAVDVGFGEVGRAAQRLGAPIGIDLIDTASRWSARYIARPDRSVVEDLTPPPAARRRRGPLLALLAAAVVLAAGSALVIGTQPRAAEQPLATAPPGRGPTPLPVGPRTTSAVPPSPTPLPGPTEAPSAEPLVPQPSPSPSSAPRPAPEPAPEAVPRAAPRNSAPRNSAPKHSRPQQPAPQPVPGPGPEPTPAPAQPRGVRGRVIDGFGTCLSATGPALDSGSCLRDRPEQIWTRTDAGQLVRDGACLTALAGQGLAVQPCRSGDAAQRWRTTGRMIASESTGECALVRPPGGRRPVAQTVRCGTGAEPVAQFVGTS
ncbi:ricin-type beta-trefoil lectin domain protein [Pseudonocardia thermophila]|uniref:ricin-type beta-trefoil lectin domain protein n=1 Tax=Pseudonocardia thermophila TaxID=1848 RepID=UPI00248F4529|nr:ricin-type beta-trefoil lectin domain protein [Pseudonocardia thermophila]